MAKRRVYELARELNMTNKELLDKLREFNIEVKNHMSSLEEDEIVKLKDSLFGNKDVADIEDTRVRPNIIRRRRKPKAEDEALSGEAATPALESSETAPETVSEIASEAAPDTRSDEESISLEATAATTAQKEETPAAEVEEEAAPAEPEKARKEEPDSETVKPEEPRKAEEKPKKTPKKQQPAKIISSAPVTAEPPVTTDVEKERKITEPEKMAAQKESQKEAPEKQAAEENAETTETPVKAATAEGPPEEPEVGETAEPLVDERIDQPEIKAAARATESPESIEAKSEPDETEKEKISGEEKPIKPKKGKKKPKVSPARIISLPEKTEPVPQPVAKAPEKPPKRTEEKPRKPVIATEKVPDPRFDSPAAKMEAEDKKKSRKKKTEPAIAADEAQDKTKKGKKQTSFKRKEVVTGDALYDQRFGRVRKGRKKGKAARPVTDKTQITIPKAIKRRIKVDETIVLADLAKRMGIKGSELIKKLMGMDIMVTLNQTIDFDTASLLANEFEFEVEPASFEEESIIRNEQDSPEELISRPPVVTIMGHVDHGKTSLLDVIRHSKVADKEAGGITQHIGAYHVPYEKGDIVFLDTPGHEAFTAMRGRGAQVTDIVILVVAADDGVMPQTIEAIDHSRAAGVPIIVAVNKIDKPGADPEKIKRELADRNLVPEDWGGDTIFVNVSAKEQTGIDEILEMILLQAEVLELKANPNKRARGYVIESRQETGRGPVATVLISEGSVNIGDAVVAGMYYGKIRAMFNDKGKAIKKAGPSYPVEIIGLTGVPMAGDEFIGVADEKDAKHVSEHRLQKQRSMDLAKTSRMSLEGLYEQMIDGEVKDLNLIIKADVQGSIEALKDSLTSLSTNEVKINIIHSATGTIHESDISLAAVSDAIILGFNVRPTGKVAQMAEEEHVSIRYYNVIYDAIKEIKNAMLGLMASTFEERVIGRAEVRQVFHVPSVGSIAGCMVIDGKIQRNQSVRIVRDGIVIHDGKISSLKRFKDDAKEVLRNYECGIGIERFNDVKVGDIIECYYLEEVKPIFE